MDDKNFRISGIPNNDEIEVPDTPKRKSSATPKMVSLNDIKNMSDKDIEEIAKQLPPELKHFMEASGIDLKSAFGQINVMLGNMTEDQFESMLENMGKSLNLDDSCMFCMGDCDHNDEETNMDNIFPTGNPRFLFPDEFGSIECYASETLYDEFVARYGTDSTQYLDDNIGLRDFLLNEITAKLNFDDIKNMRFINSNKYFILFYMEPKDELEYGFYAAVIKKGENNFAVYIPTYCNTFDVLEDENGEFEDVCLYDYEETPFMFEKGPNDITSFKFLAANLIEFAISFALAPKKHVLLSPNAFGVIKNTRASISGDSSTIPVGRISSNGSINSTLLLKDAELPLDKENHTIFMKFPNVVDEHFLRFLSAPLFEVDFNNCPLLENVELKYTSDGRLYFEVDHLGDI